MDKFAKLKIEQTGEYPILSNTRVFLNNMDITSSIKQIYIEAGPDQLTRVVLDLVAYVDIPDITAYAVLDDKTE